MRRDMPKVIVERPRVRGRAKGFGERKLAFERASRDRADPEALPYRMPMKFASTSHLNENLAPLRRFLRRRVGAKWDDVYSELRAHLAPRRAIDMHVLEHLYDDVVFTRREADGMWIHLRDGRLLGRLHDPETRLYRRRLFYVCCDTGRLRLMPERPRKKREKGTWLPLTERYGAYGGS